MLAHHISVSASSGGPMRRRAADPHSTVELTAMDVCQPLLSRLKGDSHASQLLEMDCPAFVCHLPGVGVLTGNG